MGKEEAHDTIERWFSSFPEVRAWKEAAVETASTEGARTLLGRRRPIRDLRSSVLSVKNHGQRAAGNTPVQGSAADVVNSAMLGLSGSPMLRKLGYRQLLQVHDEII